MMAKIEMETYEEYIRKNADDLKALAKRYISVKKAQGTLDFKEDFFDKFTEYLAGAKSTEERYKRQYLFEYMESYYQDIKVNQNTKKPNQEQEKETEEKIELSINPSKVEYKDLLDILLLDHQIKNQGLISLDCCSIVSMKQEGDKIDVQLLFNSQFNGRLLNKCSEKGNTRLQQMQRAWKAYGFDVNLTWIVNGQDVKVSDKSEVIDEVK